MQLLQESFQVFENLQSASFWDVVMNVASGIWKLLCHLAGAGIIFAHFKAGHNAVGYCVLTMVS